MSAMRRGVVVALALGIVQHASANQNAAGVLAPVGKIGETMRNLMLSVQDEMKQDEQVYKGLYEWCNAAFAAQQGAQQRYQGSQQELGSKLSVQQALTKQLRDETASLEDEIKDAQAAVQQASQLRQQEHTDYLNEQRGVAGMLTVLNRAGEVLGSSASKQTLLSVTQSLQQIAATSSSISNNQRDQLALFAQKATAAASEDSADLISQTSSVNQVLKELISTFQNGMASAGQQERKQLSEYDSLIRLKRLSYQQLVTSKDTKDANLAESLQLIAQLQRSLQDAQGLVREAGGYLKDVQAACGSQSSLWATRSQGRSDIAMELQNAIAALGADAPVQQSYNFQTQPVAQQLPQQMPQQMQQMQMQQMQQMQMQQMQQQQMQQQQMQQGVMSFAQVATQQQQQQPWMQAPSTGFTVASASSAALQQPQMVLSMPSLSANMQMQAPQPQMQTPPQQQQVLAGPKANSYTAVKGMVDQMMHQMQIGDSSDDKHKAWCDEEISRNQAVQQEKQAKLQRLTTKVDSEQEMVSELEQDLAMLAQEAGHLRQEQQALVQLRTAGKTQFNRAQRNHQMAQQILKQASIILQRFSALATQSQLGVATGFMQAASAPQASPVAPGALDILARLTTKYTQMEGVCQKGETAAELDVGNLQRISQALGTELVQTQTFKSNLRLQALSALDEDKEDTTTLQTQVQSVTAYVSRLRSTCADIVTHFDDRLRRRTQNMKVLQEAQNIISVDNADAIHSKLEQMAQSTDSSAASLLSSSSNVLTQPQAQFQQPQQFQQQQAQFQQPQQQAQLALAAQAQQVQQVEQVQQVAQAARGTPAVGGGQQGVSILDDLKSLQDISYSQGQQQDGSNSLNMLSAGGNN